MKLPFAWSVLGVLAPFFQVRSVLVELVDNSSGAAGTLLFISCRRLKLWRFEQRALFNLIIVFVHCDALRV